MFGRINYTNFLKKMSFKFPDPEDNFQNFDASIPPSEIKCQWNLLQM